MKLIVICFALWSVGEAAYYSRMANSVSRMRAPTAFRPGVSLRHFQQAAPGNYPGQVGNFPGQVLNYPGQITSGSYSGMTPRYVQAPSQRSPYVLYRNPPQHRYAVKHYGPGMQRNIYPSHWKSPRVPISEFEFMKAASAPPSFHTNGGAIHTIPAPNLSLSEKPIVVIDADAMAKANSGVSKAPKPTYEVTEKYVDQSVYQVPPKIETPVGFSKATSLTLPEIQALVRNGAALQLASEYGLSAIALPQQTIAEHHQNILQHNLIPQQQIVQQPSYPQQFTMQSFTGIPSQNDLVQAGAEGIVISPSALYQDPSYLQKIQNQLLQRFPSVEFIPYLTDVPQTPQVQVQQQTASQSQPQPQFMLLSGEQITKQPPSSFITSVPQKSVVQRETPEKTLSTLMPQGFVSKNITENQIEVSPVPQAHNITLQLISTEAQPTTTTLKYILETTTDEQKTTPVYYSQDGNIVTDGFYSVINEVRAAAAAQEEKPNEPVKVQQENDTTTIDPELRTFFAIQNTTNAESLPVTELKPILGIPFAKKADTVNVAYTLVRTDQLHPKMSQNGAMYTGQLVEASVSEDQEFNKQKASFIMNRPPLRLVAVTQNQEELTTTTAAPKPFTVKAKIPQKSKLIFDDKTGEPVLRIYASYIENPTQKELIASKLANVKNFKDFVTRKQDYQDIWKTGTMKMLQKPQSFDSNQVTSFGMKLKSRSDSNVPLFDDYEE